MTRLSIYLTAVLVCSSPSWADMAFNEVGVGDQRLVKLDGKLLSLSKVETENKVCKMVMELTGSERVMTHRSCLLSIPDFWGFKCGERVPSKMSYVMSRKQGRDLIHFSYSDEQGVVMSGRLSATGKVDLSQNTCVF